MKTLYIGHYREGTGWSQSAINHILALDSAGVDVVCRNFQLSNQTSEIPDRIEELQKKDLKNIDYCIQNVLPNHLAGSTKFKKNIAFFPFETRINKDHLWVDYFNLVDELWVPSTCNQKMLDAINIKSRVVLPAVENKPSDQKINLGASKFKFYSIVSEWKKQNVEGLLRSYFSEFSLTDNVCLVLIVNSDGLSPQERSSRYSELIENVKKSSNIHTRPEYYPAILLVTQDLDKKGLHALHFSCDCYVDVGHGCIWDDRVFSSLVNGSHAICSKNGIVEDIAKENGDIISLVSGDFSPCDQEGSEPSALFTAREDWFIPSGSEIKSKMREAVGKNKINKQDLDIVFSKFSHNTIGNKMKDILND